MSSWEFGTDSSAAGALRAYNMQISGGATPFADLRGTLLFILRLRNRVARRLANFARLALLRDAGKRAQAFMRAVRALPHLGRFRRNTRLWRL